MKERVSELRRALFDDFRAVLDEERFTTFVNSLGDWMPIDDQGHGISSARAIHDKDMRFFLVNHSYPSHEGIHLGYGISSAKGFMRFAMGIGEIQEFVRPQLQDWIDRARILLEVAGPWMNETFNSFDGDGKTISVAGLPDGSEAVAVK